MSFNYSKSAISSYDFCPYAFYKSKILNERGLTSRVAVEGTELHKYFEMFFAGSKNGGIDFDKLWVMDVENYFGTTKNEVFSYFMNKLYSYVDECYKDDGKFYMNIKSFAVWNTSRWREIRYRYKSQAKCRRYFMPRAVEERIFTNHPDIARKLKGFVDIRFVCPKTNSRERVRLTDYKTGGIPKGIRREIENGRPPYSKELASKLVFEGNFYCFIYLLKNGYEVKADAEGLYNVYKSGLKVNIGWLEYEYIFTNGLVPHIARKKCNIRSIRNIFKKIAKIEKHYADWDAGLRDFDRDPNEWKCSKCSNFMEDCSLNMDELQAEIIYSLIVPETIEINEKFLEKIDF